MWELYKQRGRNVKVCYEFGNDSMKMCFKYKTRMKVDHTIKKMRIVLLSCTCDFWRIIFCHEFFIIFEHAHIFLIFYYYLNSLKVLHNKWCSPHYVYIMWTEMIKLIKVPKKERFIILNVFPVYFFGLKNLLGLHVASHY